VVKSSLLLPSLALLPAALATAALTPTAAMSDRQQQQYSWGGVAGVVGLWRAGLLCCYAWAAGGHMLEIVFTERVIMAAEDDPQPTAPLLAALQHKDPIVQVRRCCCCCCCSAFAASRQKMIWTVVILT
jgi:hypothetical protein